MVILPTTPLHPGDEPVFEDSLDRHVDDVLKRPSKLRRTLMGVWSFLKTRQSRDVFFFFSFFEFDGIMS